MRKAILTACLVAGTFLGALDSHAYVVTFEQLAHNDDQFVEHGATYTEVEGGFRFTNTATVQGSGFDPSFATAGTQLTGIYTGSTALFNDNDNGQTVLTRVDGGTFNLHAISLAELLPGNPVTVTFIGTLSDSSTVTQSFTLDGNPGAENFTFNSNFSNLVSVSWVNGANYHQFDNVDATPTLISFTVTTAANNGTITSTPNPTVNSGATTTVTGSADTGYYFTDVSGCGGPRQANMDQSRTTFQYTTGEITSSCTVTANFAAGSPHTITTSAGTHGAISQSQTVGYGLDANITITPNPHYNVADVLVDGKPFDGKVSGNTYTIPEVTALHTISATFILQGDVNGDGSVDLQDAIAAMRLLSNIPPIPGNPPVHKAAGVGGNKRIGIADVSYILQTLAALRQ